MKRSLRLLLPCAVFWVAIVCSTSGQSFLTNGLVGYYPFSGDAKDTSGNGNNALVYGAQLAANRFGRGLDSYSFASVGQYIETTNSTGFPISTNDFTVSVWLRLAFLTNVIPSDHQVIFCNKAVNQFQLDLNPFSATNAALDFFTGGHGGASDCQTTSVGWTTNQWYNLMVVRSTNVIKIYRNGSSIGSATTANGNTAAAAQRILNFGYRKSDNQHQFYGQLDDIRIFSRALSTNEISQLLQYEAADAGVTGVSRALRLICTNLVAGGLYQIQSSADLTTWTNYRTPFVAPSSNYYPYVDVDWGNSYFRLNKP